MPKICKILLVEDHCDIQDLLRELFASEGYRFVIVGDGAAMRDALDRDPAIDAVVIDVLLPGGIDGLTLAREVAARGLPAILVTGDHTQVAKLQASGHRYLLKPFALASFVAMIEELLRKTKAECEHEAGTPLFRFAREPAAGDDEAGGIAQVELPLPGEAAP